MLPRPLFPTCCERARREERFGLARELHDRLGLHTSLLFLDLAQNRAGPDVNRKLERNLDLLEAELRAILSELTHAPRDRLPFDDQLRSMLTRLSDAIRCRTELRLDPKSLNGVPGATLQALLKIIQEALNNIAKHASATPRVFIELKRTPRGLSLLVENDDDPSEDARERFCTASFVRESGYGIRNMRERVRALGGVLRIRRLPGKSYRLRATIPMSLPLS